MLGFSVSGLGLRVSDFGFKVSGVRMCFGFRVWGLRFRGSRLRLRVWEMSRFCLLWSLVFSGLRV